jgi:hypothetical protein
MQANPLVGATPTPKAPAADSDQRVISLVSNVAADKIAGLQPFLAAFTTPEVRAEVNPFRHVIQRKARRSMGGKFSKGLTHEVTENIEINPNEDLFGLRRWLGGIRQSPAAVMLLAVNKIKEEPLAAPLIFSELLKTGRPVLVAGADRSTQDQLFAKIDIACEQVPETIQQNNSLKTMLMARVQRRKGFISTIRHLLDLEFLPAPVQEKVNRINGGGDPSELNEPETVNLSLLADLSSRYRNALMLYKETLQNSTLNVQQLVSMFEILMSDIPLSEALEQFSPFLGKDDERPEEVRSKSELFGYLNRFINSTEGGSRGTTRSEKVEQLFKRIISVVIAQRAKVDPVLWRRCSFIFDPEPEERALLATLEPMAAYVAKTKDGGEASINAEFKQRLGEAVFELVTIANQNLDQSKGEGALARQRAAGHLLPLFQMAKFQAGHLVQISDTNRATLLNKDKFLGLFKNIPITVQDLEGLAQRLQSELYRDQQIIEAVRKSTLDVIVGHDRDREKALREIYIVNAAQELVNFSFHIGDQNISSLERLCGVSVAQSRFGFEVSLQPQRPNSVGLFTHPNDAALGTLQNEPSVLSRAYTALIGMQVERLVKKAVDHKIGYLQQTFGENFFEVVYQQVINRFDLPLSRGQLAWFVKERGLLGSLGEKGFKSEGRENDLGDPFMTLEELALSHSKPQRDFKEFAAFPQRFAEAIRAFKQLLADLRAAGDQDPTRDVHALLWSLYRKGIYNMDRPEAKEAFRKSEFYTQLKDIIAKISSENYSVFTKDIQQDGVKVYVMPKHHALLTLGNRFAYLVESKVVRYQLIASPAEVVEELDQVSRVFHDKLDSIAKDLDTTPEFKSLFEAAAEVQRATEVWREHSRHLAFALLDRFLSETVIKQLRPGKIQAQNLWYLPDATKLCLGPSLTAQNTVPFSKMLQVPENMGNLQKNPKSCSTTIDDFTIEVHKIARLRAELDHYESVAEDVLDILQNLTHERAESQLVGRYEQGLQQFIRILSKPLRHFTEKDVQNLHTVASLLKNTLQAFYNTPGTQKDQLVMRVQNQLQARRSDGHQLKLNFTDVFVLEKTQIRVMQKVKQGEETVSKQRKVEVEVDATYQTLSARIREVVRTHEVLAAKRHIVISPEGQKKKQADYVLDIIGVLQSLRGNALTFYVDSTMLSDDQMRRLAAHVKPHNFFRMDDLKPEAPEGAQVDGVKDPLSGRMMRKEPGPDAQAGAAPQDGAQPGDSPPSAS